MTQVTVGASSNARPPQGRWPLLILTTKHSGGSFGPQIEVTGRMTVTGPEGEERLTVKRWLSYPSADRGGERNLPNDHVIAQLAAAALFGKTELDKGQGFDDEDPNFAGKTVLAEVRHYENGNKSKNPGAPNWTFKSFAPFTALIGPEEVEAIKAQLKAVFAAEVATGQQAFKDAVTELVKDAIDSPKLIAELTPEEAVQVKAAIKIMAKQKTAAAATTTVTTAAGPVPGNAVPVPGNGPTGP